MSSSPGPENFRLGCFLLAALVCFHASHLRAPSWSALNSRTGIHHVEFILSSLLRKRSVSNGVFYFNSIVVWLVQLSWESLLRHRELFLVFNASVAASRSWGREDWGLDAASGVGGCEFSPKLCSWFHSFVCLGGPLPSAGLSSGPWCTELLEDGPWHLSLHGHPAELSARDTLSHTRLWVGSHQPSSLPSSQTSGQSFKHPRPSSWPAVIGRDKAVKRWQNH